MAQQGWHREDIKAALVKRYGPVTRLSQSWGFHPGTISTVLGGRLRLTQVEMRIAQAIEVPLHTLWPDRWTPEGLRRPRRVNSQEIATSGPSAHPEKQKAA